MSNQEAPFSFTTKVNGDLLTVRGGTFEEFVANLGNLLHVEAISGLVDVIQGTALSEAEAIANAQAALGGTVVSAPAVVQPAPVPQAPVFQPVAPAVIAPAAPAAAAIQAPSCQHGPMKQIPGGISKKTGKPYNAFWACQWPNRDEQCQAVFPN